MTTRDDFDRHLAAWFEASAPSSEPEPLLGQVLARTARTRRRPAWRIPERWIPMSAITTRSAAVNQIPWRTVGLIALLVIALIGSALLFVGTRRPALPPPFGVAGNGALIYSLNGDIVARSGPQDPVRPLIAGADGAVVAPDGTRFVFGRHGADDQVDEWVADVAGTGQHKIDIPFRTISWVDWAPSSDELYVANEDGSAKIAIVPADGGPSTTLDLGMTAMVPMHRPNYPEQIVFRGKDAAGDWGLFLVGRDGVSPKRLALDPGFQQDPSYADERDQYFQGPIFSSDGKTLMYYTMEPGPRGTGLRQHLATIGPAGEVVDDVVMTFDPTADDEWGAQWLPAEDGIIFQSRTDSMHTLKIHRSSVSPKDVHDLGVRSTGDWIGFVISPDGQELIAMLPPVGTGDMSLRLVDLHTFKADVLDIPSEVTWQRVAP
ncbi:MAG TPA: hypothetical protein VFN41_13545 [Candidatus Limnocylindrales bacterium]|nr:hypothetical protein [Candidatus Limnocylindrales bacterium]